MDSTQHSGPPTAPGDQSPLRAARKAIPGNTLERVCEDINALLPEGKGVTPSMLSGWELGKRVTSDKYRELLAEHYKQPIAVLFRHQDEGLNAHGGAPVLLVGYKDLQAAMIDVSRRARHYLAVLGSRSRDIPYLDAIEQVLAARPELIHYRVLFGSPHHPVLKEHLLRLLELRDPADRSVAGVKTLHIGLVEDTTTTPERFFCASETAAVVPIPSLTSAEAFDSGVRFDGSVGERLIDHARQCYSASRRIESPQAISDLPTVRS